MTFLHPYILLALVVPLLLAVCIIVAHRRAGAAWRSLVSPAHPELVHRKPRWQAVLPPALALLALSGLIIAAARPINGYTQSEATATGRNLLIALDISRSMETQDVSPSRLEEARAAAYELIDALPGDKIGLMVFSGEADVVVPLTYDHTALRDALEQVNRDWAGYGGTNFGLLLRTAMQNFARSAPDGSNALVILSDGEDTVDSSTDIADEARKSNLLVITVGIGTPTGGAIPDPEGDDGLWQDASGRHVISKLDVAALSRFAQATGGAYFTMGAGANLAAFAREAVEKMRRHEESYATGRVPLDLFAWFAVPALLALLASIILGSEWRTPKHTLVLLLAGTLLGQQAHAAQSPEQAYGQGFQSLQKGDLPAAQESISQALLSSRKDLQAASHLALGNMRTRAIFERLRKLYAPQEDADSTATPAPTPSIEALQSIVKDLQAALTPYQDALAADASLIQAQQNIDKIQELIRKIEEEIERLKQQQQEQQQQQQKDQQQQQDKPQDKKDNQDQQQDKQDKENKQDQQQSQQDQQDQQRDQQDKQEQQNQQAQQDKQGQQAQQQAQQDKQDQRTQQQQPQEQQEQGAQPKEEPAAADEPELSEEEKNKQRAASILRMHLDEEKGSPIPHFNNAVRPPSKDY